MTTYRFSRHVVFVVYKALYLKIFEIEILFLDPRGGSPSLTHVVVLHLLLVDFFVSQPTVFIETS